jgi:hypothetical protein
MVESPCISSNIVPEVILPVRERENGSGLVLRWPIECPASGYAASGNIDYNSGEFDRAASRGYQSGFRAFRARLAPRGANSFSKRARKSR